MPHYPIRPFTLADLPAVMRLEHLSFAAEAFDWQTFVGLFQDSPQTFLIAEDDDDLIGYITVYVDDEPEIRGYIASIAVSPSYRRQGIATALIEAVHTILSAGGVQAMSLHVGVEHTNAIALYQTVGFHIDHTIQGYYGEGQDAYYMIRP